MTCCSLHPVFHSLNFAFRLLIRSSSYILVSSTFVEEGILIPIDSVLKPLFSFFFVSCNRTLNSSNTDFPSAIRFGSSSPKSLSWNLVIFPIVLIKSLSDTAMPELIFGIDMGMVKSGSISKILIISETFFSNQSVLKLLSTACFTASFAVSTAFLIFSNALGVTSPFMSPSKKYWKKPSTIRDLP